MPGTWSEVWNMLLGFLREEWFWAMLALVISVGVFAMESRTENKISRANFIYNISNDFGNNERILRVYQWLEKCRRENHGIDNYRNLHISTAVDIYDEENKEAAVDFIDIDTYINHFEAVYVILNSVHIRNIDELFQQRFLSFMFNPYIQKEELFACFIPDKNDFLLQQQWLRSLCRKNHFTSEELVEYLNTFTCGTFEFSPRRLALTKERWPNRYPQKVQKYLINYVQSICDPACRYGFYEVRNKNKERKVFRIIRSEENDRSAILELQERVIAGLESPWWYSSSTEEEIRNALENQRDYACVQVCDGQRIVAFAYAIINPTPAQDVNTDLKNLGLPYADDAQCILDTVFVDPEYRGYGLQDLLIKVLCSWAATLGKRHISATIHPENRYSAENFQKNGFKKVTDTPIPKYGDLRNVFARKLSKRDTKPAEDGTYTVYPYV